MPAASGGVGASSLLSKSRLVRVSRRHERPRRDPRAQVSDPVVVEVRPLARPVLRLVPVPLVPRLVPLSSPSTIALQPTLPKDDDANDGGDATQDHGAAHEDLSGGGTGVAVVLLAIATRFVLAQVGTGRVEVV